MREVEGEGSCDMERERGQRERGKRGQRERERGGGAEKGGLRECSEREGERE